MQFFHASPYDLQPGTILRPGSEIGKGLYRFNSVCVCTERIPHISIRDDAIQFNWSVYEVDELPPHELFEDMNGNITGINSEIWVSTARVKRFIAKTKELMES